MKIDKTSYKKYKMGKIAESISKRVDPAATKAEIYVGLEHLDPENLHIREYGKPSDVKGVKLEISKGDVIFGKRRAYQRKAAIADFDGICSAHAMVLRANPDVILPELLPFFMHSDVFMNRAIDISEGSLSPTIKWKILREQEFLLPPLAEQKKLADLLWAGDKVLQRYRELEKRFYKYLLIAIDNHLIHGIQDVTNSQTRKSKCGYVRNDIEVKMLGECLEISPQYGANSPSIPMTDKSKPRYIRITDIDDNGELLENEIVTIKDEEYSTYILEEDDFLFARTGNTVGKSYLYKKSHDKAVFAGYLIRFKVNRDILLPGFLEIFSHSSKFSEFKRKVIKVGAQPNINSKEYQDMYLPVPSIHEQESIVHEIKKVRQSIRSISQIILSTNKLNKSLISQIFG